jgi:hypothetical protein
MTPFEERRDALAQLLAASLMGLVDDPTGADLPEDCWGRMRPKANAILFILSPTTDSDHRLAGVALEKDYLDA